MKPKTLLTAGLLLVSTLSSLWHVLFSSDGKTIAAARGNGVFTLWKTE
jgi:hypothetical protein